jgi:hypothetical protein
MRPYLENPFTKIGLVEWFKVQALSSRPSMAKKKNYTGAGGMALVVQHLASMCKALSSNPTTTKKKKKKNTKLMTSGKPPAPCPPQQPNESLSSEVA